MASGKQKTAIDDNIALMTSMIESKRKTLKGKLFENYSDEDLGTLTEIGLHIEEKEMWENWETNK